MWGIVLAAGLGGWGIIAGASLVALVLGARRWWMATVLAAAVFSVAVPATRLEPLPPGRVEVIGVMRTDVVEGRFGPWALVDTSQGPVLFDLAHSEDLIKGLGVRAVGTSRGEVGMARGVAHRGAVKVDEIEALAPSSNPLTSAGNLVRGRVLERLEPFDEGRSLLAGFLIGDTSRIPQVDVEAMRRSGLSHFTAVSGSNVALYLGLVAVMMAPFALRPRRRALVGLLALPVYAAATRFEPSVMRASVMAGLFLAGRLVGIGWNIWQVLGATVAGLLIITPTLAVSAGFQLSVAATVGVLVGGHWPIQGGRISRALAVSIGAQAAVAPLLLVHFGSLSVVSPVANLVAAPLVTFSTLTGAVGVAGVPGLVSVGSEVAVWVLAIARAGSGFPQLGWVATVVALAGGALFLMAPRLRGVLSVVGALSLVLVLLAPLGRLMPASVVVLDVGQGDAILIAGGDGRFVLVDGGPDPSRLIDRLHHYGVSGLELVVLTHVHADHATGLGALPGRFSIGRVWARPGPHESAAAVSFLEAVKEHGITLVGPDVGDTVAVGAVRITVLGPLRRYASPNDESIVLLVEGSSRSMLLSGDIETVAQGELEGIAADVLKVPHQGAATSDADWLGGVGAEEAIISVGPNNFGHPADWVIEVLEDSGAMVHRTDEDGDIIVSLR